MDMLNYSKTSYLFSVLTTVDPLVYVQSWLQGKQTLVHIQWLVQ